MISNNSLFQPPKRERAGDDLDANGRRADQCPQIARAAEFGGRLNASGHSLAGGLGLLGEVARLGFVLLRALQFIFRGYHFFRRGVGVGNQLCQGIRGGLGLLLLVGNGSDRLVQRGPSLVGGFAGFFNRLGAAIVLLGRDEILLSRVAGGLGVGQLARGRFAGPCRRLWTNCV